MVRHRTHRTRQAFRAQAQLDLRRLRPSRAALRHRPQEVLLPGLLQLRAPVRHDRHLRQKNRPRPGHLPPRSLRLLGQNPRQDRRRALFHDVGSFL